MSGPEGAGSAPAFLRALIAGEGGSISVERFMQEALYHPTFGYYARRVSTVGRTGDFSTSATLYPAIGQSIARWARAHRREVARRGRWHLVELGGGTGELAAAVLRALGWCGRLGLRYHLVELSGPLRAQQQARLEASGRVSWHPEIRSALAAADGCALIFSNEFVDAFPCAQWTWDATAAEWREVYVQWPERAEFPTEATRSPLASPPAAIAPMTLKAGRRVETHQSYRRWLESWVDRWHAGRMLTIDYGDQLPELYRRQPGGTLRAYCRHQRFTGPEIYRRFGQQDLTADVNFTDLQAWGEAAGFTTTRFETQEEFLRRWLPEKTLRSSGDPRLDFLLDPAGAGGAFKVLEQDRPSAPGQKVE